MRVKNTSPYKDKDLKKFIYVCARELRGGRQLCKDLIVVASGKYIPQWLKVDREKFRTTNAIRRSQTPTGSAYYGKCYHEHGYGYLAKIRIPAEPDLLDKKELAFMIMHELAHCKGETHNQMRKRKKPYYRWSDLEDNPRLFEFAEGLTLGLKEPPIKKQRNVRLERYQKALLKVKEYESKKKRTDKLLKKWQNKVKYYENLQ